MWVCECSCDKHTVRPVPAKSLLEEKSTSCGCTRVDTKDSKMRMRDENNIVTHKKCCICQRMLPISEYYKNKYSYDGYFSECKQCSNETVRNRYNVYKKGAKSRNMDFDLSLEQFDEITSKPCYYCGEYYKEDYFGKKYNGIDRIDSNVGYNENNAVPCCEYCNRMKLDYTEEFFLNQIKKIFYFQEEKRRKMKQYLEIPTVCPACGFPTKIVKQNDSEVLYCTNPNCQGKLLARMTYFVSKKAMNIDGLSEKTLEAMLKLDMLHKFSDLYHPENWADKLLTVPGFGKKSVDKLLTSIEASRHNVDLAHFICALSIPNVGSVQARELAKTFKTWEEFYMACIGDYDFRGLEGFGEVLNSNLHNYFNVNDDIGDLLDYIDFADSSDSGTVRDNGSHSVSSLEGMVFVITGKLNNFANRGQLTEEIVSHGGSVSSSISKMTNFLINNDLNSTSSKNKKAKELGIPIISEEDFLRMVG